MTEMPQEPEEEQAEDESGMRSRAAENDRLERGKGERAVGGEGRRGYF